VSNNNNNNNNGSGNNNYGDDSNNYDNSSNNNQNDLGIIRLSILVIFFFNLTFSLKIFVLFSYIFVFIVLLDKCYSFSI
jgi:hypothetical protein